MAVERGTYTVDEAADRLGVSRTHIYELIKVDSDWSRLAIRVGRRILLPRWAIEGMIERAAA